MAFNATFAVRAGRGLTSAQKALLFALASRCQPGKNTAFPSMDTLAADAGLTRTGAQGVVKQLEALGWLKVKRIKREKNRDAPNEYTITPPEGRANGIGPVGQPDEPSLGQPDWHEVKRLSEVKTESNKSLLTTGGSHEGQSKSKTKHPAAQLAQWMKVTGCEVEFATLFRDADGKKQRIESLAEESRGAEARAHNRDGHCIFIRPVRGDAQTCILLDDLDVAAVEDIASRWRCAIVETSENNFQAWIALTRPATEDERKRVQRVVGAGYGADKGSVSGDHYGRCPGFINNKPDRDKFLSRLIQAAERGKLLDVDAVLRQERAAPVTRTRFKSARAVLTFPRPAPRTIYAGGDSSESGREWGWVMGAIESGMSPAEVEARLADQAELRRGKDAHRYASQTVAAALKKVRARAA